MTEAGTRHERIVWREIVALCNRLQATYYLIRLGELITAILPLRVSYALAGQVANALYVMLPMLRDAAAANVRQVLGASAPPAVISRVTRQVFRNYCKYLVDFVRIPSLEERDLERLLNVAGFEHLDHALRAGKGVLFVGLHFGSFEYGWAILAARGYRVAITVDTFRPEKLDALVQKRRAAKGVTLIPVEMATASRKILRALHRNEVLALLIDRPLKEEGVVVQFFDRDTRVPAGPAALALRSGAQIVPAYLARKRDNTLAGTILPPVDPEVTGDRDRDVQALTQRVMSALEGSVRQYPDQWYMFREMWPREAGGGRRMPAAQDRAAADSLGMA